MDALTRATAFRFQKSEEPKSPADDDILDAPPAGDDRVEGNVSTSHR
jgi:hypothetical protein